MKGKDFSNNVKEEDFSFVLSQHQIVMLKRIFRKHKCCNFSEFYENVQMLSYKFIKKKKRYNLIFNEWEQNKEKKNSSTWYE